MKSTLLAHSLILSALAFHAAGQTRIDLRNQSKNVDFSNANSTKPFRSGTQLPAACSTGEMFFKTDASAGQNLYACTASDVWTLESGSGGAPAVTGQANKVLSNDGAATDWRALAGDVSGAPQSLIVNGIQGHSVASSGPGDGQVLRWNASAAQWQPSSFAVPGGPNYSQAFTGQTSVTLLGSAHGLGTANLLVECYNSASPASLITPSAVTVGSTTFDVTVSFATAQSGRCVVNGSGGNSTIWSVFGRTGAVAAASGDYGFPQITGTVSNAQVAAGVDAVKIGAGTVGNTVFGYLANVTGDIQAQFAGKAALVHSHTAGGDVSGGLASLTTTGIQGHPVSTTAPTDGQALVWSVAQNAWQPGSAALGGAIMASQLNDFAVTRTNSTVLAIGASCSTGTPCNARFGNTVYSFTQSCNATIGAGTGAAYIYVTPAGTLTVGHNVTLAASAGCVAQAGVTSFPADSVPLYTWTATSGTWATAGGHDFRALLSAKSISAGTGLATLDSGGRTTVSVDTALVPTFLTGAATLDFPSITSGACSADLSFTLPGAAVNDAVTAGWPAALEAGLVGTMRVSAANTIAVRVCNLAGSAVDPASATFRAAIVRSF
jgi:hypothetical protein